MKRTEILLMETVKDKGENMNLIAQKITSAPTGSPEELALRIKQEAPGLSDLSPDQLEMIARLVMTQRLAAELNQKVDLAGIDWQKERDTFLGDAKSPHTRRSYAAALGKLETWAALKKINLLAMDASQADNFIRALKEEGRAPVSVRRDIAAASAFYTFLERTSDGKIKNAFRGTRLRPPNETKKGAVIPTAADYEVIIAELPPTEKAIVACLALRGLRAGALPTLELKAGRYHGLSKGKKLTEGEAEGITLPLEALDAIKDAGLNMKKPFAWKTFRGTAMNSSAIESRINKAMAKLFKEGKIRRAFSCHAFRHYFAKNEYLKDRDIVRVSKLLNHGGIQVTQVYLKSLGVKL
ncbi:MAG: site-specific integrase [Treponema sp.]|nr:site-specific integrase [Treponema sp.]